MQLHYILKATCCGLFFPLFTFNLPTVIMADSPGTTSTRTVTISQNEEATPPVQGRPRRTVPGGTRDLCLSGTKPLAALIPEKLVGLTTTEYPTWFFYIPQTSAKEGVFSLYDENNQQIYNTNVKTPQQSGVISVSIPAASTSSALAVGKTYRWNFNLICNSQDQAKNKIISGFTQRVAPSQDLVSKLENAKTMRDRLKIYAQAGIWHETLTILAQLRRDNPNDPDLAKDWADLLKQVGLAEIAEEPLVRQ